MFDLLSDHGNRKKFQVQNLTFSHVVCCRQNRHTTLHRQDRYSLGRHNDLGHIDRNMTLVLLEEFEFAVRHNVLDLIIGAQFEIIGILDGEFRICLNFLFGKQSVPNLRLQVGYFDCVQ